MSEEIPLKETEPPAGGWSDKEIEAFTRRVGRFTKAGMNEMDAEKLAQQMLYRDRPESGDDRRICLECKGFKKGLCSLRSLALWWVLQRCDRFSMRGAA